ncbi:hypothetical protein RD149_13615 [Gordonia westfalica]|uniref:Mce-associated membrane protein n=1 Tax=Gordonia westfalica TaxID=158898 RepID=A0ABU2GTM3_9ACTN|nr:hypothetical protein [Gordonia westfalica]MDS1114806.1 hypothetical protein [Gordonia westfalica]
MSTPTIDTDNTASDNDTEKASTTAEKTDDKSASTRKGGDADSLLTRASGVKIGLKQVVSGALVVAMIATIGILGYVVADKSDTVNTMQSEASAAAAAEKRALDYATGAAEMNFKDLAAWNTRLTANTSPELTAKLTDAASSMEQVIVPLQWTSTAQPIAATVKSHEGSVFVVAAFVSVMTKNAQAPDGVQSTASYTVTMDSSKDWLITDVGGIDGAVAPK